MTKKAKTILSQSLKMSLVLSMFLTF